MDILTILAAVPQVTTTANLQSVGPEGSLLGQGVIAALIGIVGWFVKTWLAGIVAKLEKLTEAIDRLGATQKEVTEKAAGEMRGEAKDMRVSLERNTRVVSVALLEMAALIPGARPMLEEAKRNSEERLKKDGETL